MSTADPTQEVGQRAICSGGGPSRTPGKVLIEFMVDEGTVRQLNSEWLLTPLTTPERAS
jgi:hypothetical protein